MANRPRRGKQMPIPPPPPIEDDSDEESSSSSEGSPQSESEVEDIVLVEGTPLQGQQAQRVQPVEEEDDEEEDEEDEEDEEEEEKDEEKEEEEKDEEEEEEEEPEDLDLDDDEFDDEEDEGDGEDDTLIEVGGQTTVEDEELIDADEDYFRPPPTPGVRRDRQRQQADRDEPVAGPSNSSRRRNEHELTSFDVRDGYDLSKLYVELIETCNSLEMDTGFQENLQEVMTSNIEKGKKLFEHLLKGAEPSSQEFDSEGRRRAGKGGGPADMYLAFLHTKLSSNIIRNRAERIGAGASIFSVDKFLESLKKEFVDEDGDYSPKLAAANISMQASVGATSLNPFLAVVGAFDRDAAVVPKVKKVRDPPRRMNMEEQEEGGGEIMNSGDSQALALVQKTPQNGMVKGMLNILKEHYSRTSESVNIYEFVLVKNSFPQTVENIFNMSFLAGTGHISLVKEENGKYKDFSLNVKPEKPPKKTGSPDEESVRNQTNRQKHIMSFNPQMFKSLVEMADGQDIIQFYQNMMENQQQEQLTIEYTE